MKNKALIILTVFLTLLLAGCSPTPTGRTITPIDEAIECVGVINAFPVFDSLEINEDTGSTYRCLFDIYVNNHYEQIDIESIQIGDTLDIGDEKILVKSFKKIGDDLYGNKNYPKYLINKKYTAYYFGVYYVISDKKGNITSHFVEQNTFDVYNDISFTDNRQKKNYAGIDDVFNNIKKDKSLNHNNTVIYIEDNTVYEINKVEEN